MRPIRVFGLAALALVVAGVCWKLADVGPRLTDDAAGVGIKPWPRQINRVTPPDSSAWDTFDPPARPRKSWLNR